MRREVNIPGFRAVTVMEMLCSLLQRVLCFRSVCFCFPCSPLLFFFLLSRSPHCLILLLLFLSFSPSVSCLLRSSFCRSRLSPFPLLCSILLLAFIARGCVRYGMHMVMAAWDMLHWNSSAISAKTLPCLFISSRFFPFEEDHEQCAQFLMKRRRLLIQNAYFWFGPWMFL